MQFWKGFIACACVFAMGCVTGSSLSSPAQAEARIFRGEGFWLEDGNGKVRGVFGITNGEPYLTMFDGNGDIILTMGQVGNGVIAGYKGILDEGILPIARVTE